MCNTDFMTVELFMTLGSALLCFKAVDWRIVFPFSPLATAKINSYVREREAEQISS